MPQATQNVCDYFGYFLNNPLFDIFFFPLETFFYKEEEEEVIDWNGINSEEKFKSAVQRLGYNHQEIAQLTVCSSEELYQKS